MLKKENLINIIYSCSVILICLVLGHITNSLLNGLPASLYGMLILTLLLSLNIIKAQKLQQTIDWIITNMGVCFVPAGVGVMQYAAFIRTYGILITLIIIMTTLILMTLVAYLYQKSFKH